VADGLKLTRWAENELLCYSFVFER